MRPKHVFLEAVYVFLMYFSCIFHVFLKTCISHVFLMYLANEISMYISCISHVFLMYFFKESNSYMQKSCISHVFLMYFIVRFQCISMLNKCYFAENQMDLAFLKKRKKSVK